MGGSIYEGNRIKLKGQGRNYFINHTVEREIAVDKHKLLILGSDFVTISVVKEAKKLGIYVIVADLMQNSPTKEEADEAWLISTTDIDLLEQKCKEEKVIAIMFGASDFIPLRLFTRRKASGWAIACADRSRSCGPSRT